MGWTTPATWVSDDWNLQIRDNLTYVHAYLPPIGSIVMYGTGVGSPPTGWLFCRGQSLPTSGTYNALFLVISYNYGGSGGSFSIPNLSAKFPRGSTLPGGSGGGVYTHTHAFNTNSGNITASVNNPDWDTVVSGSGGSHTHNFTDNTYNHGHGFVASGNVTRTAGTNLEAAAPSHNHSFGASTFNHNHGWNNHPGHSHSIGHDHNVSFGGNVEDNTAFDDFAPPYTDVEFIIRYV